MSLVVKVIVLCLSVGTTVSVAQPGVTQSDRAMLETLLRNSFGADYSLDDVVNIDSSAVLRGAIRDPYGTLQHCFVFTGTQTASADSDFYNHGVIAFYRNNVIIWHTGTEIRLLCGTKSAVNSIMDLNSDGRVDVVASWDGGCQRMASSAMWILSWDGQSGSVLNDVNPDDGTSAMEGGANNDFERVDINGDGVWEVQTTTTTSYMTTDDNGEPQEHDSHDLNTYQWDGKRYGQITFEPPEGDPFYPRNSVVATIGTRVYGTLDSLTYRYAITNTPNSPQGINAIYVSSDDSPISSRSGRPEWKAYQRGTLASWRLDDESRTGSFITPGTTDTSLLVVSSGLPSINNCFVRGANKVPMTPSTSEDIMRNSTIVPVIAPLARPNPEPYASLSFTDTLLSYTTRSRALGWILDQPTADKYTGLFNRIHADLDQQQKTMALLRVDTVLSQVHQDSAGHLTSEAYALLRFNTEYLKTLIPEDPLPIQLWYFTATVIANRHVELEWGTLSEENNYGFFAQKSQSETSGFTDIPGGFVAGHGTTNDPHEYSWIDTSTSPGQWYYRLKQVDFDGTLHYTDAERVYIPEELQRTQIVNFKAGILSDNSVYLEWTTLSEYLCEGFYVQRKGDKEEDFQDVNEGFVPGHGTTNKEQLYSFTDSEVKEGKWYYRLKHQGDGTEWYSDTIHVPFTEDDTEVGALLAEPLTQDQVRLDWTTRKEVNNGYFEVQVSRGDSLHYRPVPNSRTPGHGTSNQRWKYTYRDTRQSSGIWCYRLKQVNVSRQARYTRSIRVSVR